MSGKGNEVGDRTLRRGIFDRSIRGTITSPVMVRVERDRIRFLSQVLGVKDPVHHEVAAARAAGHRDLLAPPSFPMVIEALAHDERARAGLPNMLELLRCDLRYLLHGGEAYVYTGPIFAGDDIEFAAEFLDFQDKKQGTLEIADVALRFSHAERGLLVTGRRTLIHRLR